MGARTQTAVAGVAELQPRITLYPTEPRVVETPDAIPAASVVRPLVIMEPGPVWILPRTREAHEDFVRQGGTAIVEFLKRARALDGISAAQRVLIGRALAGEMLTSLGIKGEG
jgi:hypothetical protein